MEPFSVIERPEPANKLHQNPRFQLNSWRLCEAVSALFALAGWAIATLDYELHYSPLRSEGNCLQTGPDHTFRWLDLVLSTCALLFLVLRHRAKFHWNSHQAKFPALTRCVFECVLLCLFPYPHFEGKVYIDERHRRPFGGTFKRRDVCYTGSEVLYALMFLRFFFVLRAVGNMSPFMDGHAKRVGWMYGVKANLRFTLRSLASSRPLLLLVILMLPPAFLAAQLIRLFERPYVTYCDKDFSAYTNSVYFTFVAMTTIAYGDFYPCTELGRFCSVLIEICGMGLFSMMIYIIDRNIRASRLQNRAFQSIHLTRLAAKLIESWYLQCKRPKTSLFLHFAQRKIAYKAGKQHLLTVRSLKDGERKEIEVKLEELDHSFTRIEIKSGSVALLSSQIEGFSQLLRSFEASF